MWYHLSISGKVIVAVNRQQVVDDETPDGKQMEDPIKPTRFA